MYISPCVCIGSTCMSHTCTSNTNTVNRFLSMEFQYLTLVIMNNFINLQLKLCSFFYLIVNDINVTEHSFIFLAF